MTPDEIYDAIADRVVDLCEEAGGPVSGHVVEAWCVAEFGWSVHQARAFIRYTVRDRGIVRVPGGLWPSLAPLRQTIGSVSVIDFLPVHADGVA